MRVLFSTGALYGFPYPLAFRLAAAAGCDGVELVLDPWILAAGPERVSEYGRRLGCPVSVLHPSLFGLPGWKGAPQAFPRLGRWALDLDCPLVVVHPPRYRGLNRNVALFDEGLEAFRRVTEGRVVLALENSAVFDGEDRRHPFVWPEQVAEFARERDIPVTFDTTHAASVGLGLRGYQSVAGRLAHIHLSDFRQPPPVLDRPSLDTYLKHHQMPGKGGMDFRAWFRQLRRDDYAGAVTIEVSPVALRLWNPWAPRRLLARSVDMVREWWADAAEAETPAVPVAADKLEAGA